MPWLLREEEVLAALEVVTERRERRRGLRGRSGFDGARLLDPARSTRTLGVRFPIDVAFCTRTADGSLQVLATRAMAPGRVGLPRPRARCVIEAEMGAFERWKLAVGDVLTLK